MTIFPSLKSRSSRLEWIDTPNITDAELSSAYQFIEFTERLTSGMSLILHFLSHCSKNWAADKPISILDMYCGRGRVSHEILKWADKKGFDVHVLAVDRYGRIIELAKEHHSQHPRLDFDVKDWNHPDFLKAQQVDYVVSSLSLHHFNNDEAGRFLKTVNLLAKKGWIVTDWIRSTQSLVLMKSLALLSRDDIVKHDGPLSIKRSFTIDEIQKILSQTGLGYLDVVKQGGKKFTISSERGLNFQRAPLPSTGLAGT